MRKFNFIVTDPDGLHARPAANFCKKANEYKSDICITKDGQTYEGKSILMVLSMGAVQGDNLEIIIDGPDEENAVEELIKTLNME